MSPLADDALSLSCLFSAQSNGSLTLKAHQLLIAFFPHGIDACRIMFHVSAFILYPPVDSLPLWLVNVT